MANATIQRHNFTQTGSFPVSIRFENEVSGLTLGNIVSSDPSITIAFPEGYDSAVAAQVFTVILTPAAESSGTFTLSLMGMVMVESQTEQITATPQTYRYDTKTSVSIEDPNIAYTKEGVGGDYLLNISFSESIRYIDKTDFDITRVEGDPVFDMTDGLIQTDTAGKKFQMVFIPKDGRKGSFRVQSSGHATLADGIRVDQVEGVNQVIHYNNIIPELDDYRMDDLQAGIYDVYIAFLDKVRGLDIDSFIQEGANLNSPKIYRNITDTGTLRDISNATRPRQETFETESAFAAESIIKDEEGTLYNVNANIPATNMFSISELETTTIIEPVTPEDFAINTAFAIGSIIRDNGALYEVITQISVENTATVAQLISAGSIRSITPEDFAIDTAFTVGDIIRDSEALYKVNADIPVDNMLSILDLGSIKIVELFTTDNLDNIVDNWVCLIPFETEKAFDSGNIVNADGKEYEVKQAISDTNMQTLTQLEEADAVEQFEDDNMIKLNQIPAKFYLLRFVVLASQIKSVNRYSLILKPNSVEGPTT